MNWLVTGDPYSEIYHIVYNANYYDQVATWTAGRWTIIYNYAEFVPEPGDIFISVGYDSSVGHTGIVISSDVNNAWIVDQNSTSDWNYDTGVPTWKHQISWTGSYSATCFIRYNHFVYNTPSWLDVNGYLDGRVSGTLEDYGTCDVYVNGQMILDDTNDFYSINGLWMPGTPYEITDVRATPGHKYLGVQSGSLTGTIANGGTSVQLKFASTHTVRFDANEGSNPPTNQTKVYGTVLKLTTSIPVRNGYEFVEWNTKADGNGTSYAPGGNYDADADVTLYAIWNSLTYTITYDANGGSGAPDPQTVSDGGATTLSSTIPTRLGYDLQGWDPDPDAEVATYQAGGSYPGGEATLYAIWEIQHFNITFNSDGAGAIQSRTVDYGNVLGELPEPQREGYFFKGWYNGSTKVTASTVVTSSMLLTAHWSEPTKMILPSAITTIESEAFYGVDTNVFVIPSGVTTIGSKAFAENPSLYSIIIYADNVTPAADAFVNCPNLTIYGHEDSQIHYYAVTKKIPFVALTNGSSDWVPYSEMPIGATIAEEKWGYDHIITETTTSTEPTMEGWTEDSTKRRWEQTETGVNRYVDFGGIDFLDSHALYSKYSNKMTNQEDATTKTEITQQSSNVGYIYYHWTLDGEWPQKAAEAGHAINVYVERTRGANPDGYTYTLFHAFEVDSILNPVYGATNSNSEADLRGDGIYSTCYVGAHNLAQYVSYWWYIAEIRQQPYTKYQRIFTFTRQTTEPMESTAPVVEGDDIANVQHYVKYGF